MKVLITGGCSFSEMKGTAIFKTWPYFLEKYLNEELASINSNPLKAYNDAVGMQGNDLISRQIIYRVYETLKTYDPSDILVGIMWSECARHSTYVNFSDDHGFEHGHHIHWNTEKNDNKKYPLEKYNPYYWMKNPESVSHGWAILNPSESKNQLARTWFQYFHDDIQSMIFTLEHILRVQWFLKNLGIKYFMTTFMEVVLLGCDNNREDLKHLYDQIDFNHFLPVSGQYEWCIKENLPFRAKGDLHPSNLAHEKFVHDIILPHLKNK